MIRAQKKIYIVYEFGHVDEAREQARQGATVIGLDFFVERELGEKNIPHVSLRDFLEGQKGEDAWWVLTQEISREWYRVPAMEFFEYEGIRIAEAPEPILQAYLARLFHYVRMYTFLKERYPDALFYIPRPVVNESSYADCFAFFCSWSVIDAAHMVGLQTTEPSTHSAPRPYEFPPSTRKTFLMRAYNAVIGLIPRRDFKIYASTYWTHVAPIVPLMKDTEFIFLESGKFYQIPWRQILAHRIRIRYPHGPVSSAQERAARLASEPFMGQWESAKGEVAEYLARARGDLDWSPVLLAFENLMRYAPRVIADVIVLREIMEEEKPDVVLQMASTGGAQHYFFLMARVASQLGIPSLELQHAGATIDPRSVYSRIETDYLATYGKDVNVWHERIGHAPDRLVAVGSPRFDRYASGHAERVEKGKQVFAKLGLDLSRPVLVAIVPVAENYVSMTNSYQLADFFDAIRMVQDGVPGLQVLFKFHNDKVFGATPGYLRELFPKDIVLVGNGDLSALLAASHAVVCNNSTVIYEAVLAQKPLVLYPWWIHDTYHAQVYERAAPLFYSDQKVEAIKSMVRACADATYREELRAGQKHFLDAYSFDGKSSERVAALLRDLPQRIREVKP